MCGISGICLLNGNNLDLQEVNILMSKLLVYSTKRGGDATGVAIIKTNKASIFKHHITGREFVDTDYYNEMMERNLRFSSNTDKTMIILGHNRAQTKGSYLNRHNNHPIITNRVIGIHNGCIGNDDNLFKYNSANFSRKAQVDSEIIFRLIDHYAGDVNSDTIGAIKKTTRLIIGSYACAAVNLRCPWILWLFRSCNPTTVLYYPKRGMIIFASEESIIGNAVEDMNVGIAVRIPYTFDEGMGINILQNRKTKFDLIKRKVIEYNDGSYTYKNNDCDYLCAL